MFGSIKAGASLAVVLLVLLLHVGHCCEIAIISQPSRLVQGIIRATKSENSWRFKSTCRPSYRIEYKNRYPGSKVFDIYSETLRKQNLVFNVITEWEKDDIYKLKFIIDPWNYQYAANYRIIIEARKGGKIVAQETARLYLQDVQLIDFHYYERCFLPHVQSITATPKDGNSIFLSWEETTSEDPNIGHCINASHWSVRMFTFSKAEDTPIDFEVIANKTPLPWKNLTKLTTNHTFLNALDTNLYYYFQVKHKGDFWHRQVQYFKIKPITFGSSVFYFGQQAPPKIQKLGSTIKLLNFGENLSILCQAMGFPQPEIRWVSEKGNFANHNATMELSHVTLDDADTYYCIASNILVNPPEGRRYEIDTWRITVIVENNPSIGGLSCPFISMESSSCRDYVNYEDFKIYTDHRNNTTSMDQEARATQIMTEIDYFIPLGTCRDFAYSMMCHHVYPYCAVQPGIPIPRKLCSHACMEFKSGRCSGYLTRNDSVYDILIEGCDDREYTGGESPECIPLSYNTHRKQQIELIKDTGACVRDDGRGYSGNQYLTQSGALCQAWSTQSPHPHPMLPELYSSDLEQAHLSCRNPGGIGNRPWCYTNDPNVRWEYCDIPKCDTCEPYTGELCKPLLGYDIGFNVSVKRDKRFQSLASIDQDISTFYREIVRLQPTEGCSHLLRVLLCHRSFPECTPGSHSKQLCSNYCLFNKTLDLLCPVEYSELTKFVGHRTQYMYTPLCHLDDSNEENNCMPISSSRTATPTTVYVDPGLSKSNCYEGNGWNYSGNISMTQNGVPCQYWDSQVPHSHSITSASYPGLIDGFNHCRNPGNLKDQPWCFTTDVNTIWDYCDVCDNVPVCLSEELCYPLSTISSPSMSAVPPAVTASSSPSFSQWSIIGLGISIFVVLVCLMGVMMSCVIIYKRKKGTETITAQNTLTEILEKTRYTINPDYPETNFSTAVTVPDQFKLLDSKKIKYVSQLGQGNFGIVFKGKAFGLKDEEVEEDEGLEVAVKTLKEEASSEIKQDFIDEAKLMFTFDHPNILKIHGVCMSEMPYLLVFEYMDEGDLTNYLRSKASSYQRRLLNPLSNRKSRTESSFSNNPASLSKTELLYICKQIASGMKYLSEKKCIHRDLACRNCLIKSDLVVKIGDFGMSRNLYSKDYYRINGKAVLPVRWMAPESLVYGKFSIEGDVWSYGVVMWEVFSFALQPYYGITNEEVTEAVRKGKTLNRPDDCPSEVYRLMKECWSMDPSDRISFPELYKQLTRLNHSYSVCESPEAMEDDSSSVSADQSPSEDNVFVAEESITSL